MKILLISASLSPGSRSRVLVRTAEGMLKEMGVETEFVDLRDYPLPLCDGDVAYDDPNVDKLSAGISGASAVLMGVPIYNFDVNAAAKNLVELTGSAWENHVTGFLCAAGGRSSYMSVMNFANDLMLDFRTLIIPRFIYAVKSDFAPGKDGSLEIGTPDIRDRVRQLAEEAVRLAPYRQLP